MEHKLLSMDFDQLSNELKEIRSMIKETNDGFKVDNDTLVVLHINSEPVNFFLGLELAKINKIAYLYRASDSMDYLQMALKSGWSIVGATSVIHEKTFGFRVFEGLTLVKN